MTAVDAVLRARGSRAVCEPSHCALAVVEAGGHGQGVWVELAGGKESPVVALAVHDANGFEVHNADLTLLVKERAPHESEIFHDDTVEEGHAPYGVEEEAGNTGAAG